MVKGYTGNVWDAGKIGTRYLYDSLRRTPILRSRKSCCTATLFVKISLFYYQVSLNVVQFLASECMISDRWHRNVHWFEMAILVEVHLRFMWVKIYQNIRITTALDRELFDQMFLISSNNLSLNGKTLFYTYAFNFIWTHKKEKLCDKKDKK